MRECSALLRKGARRPYPASRMIGRKVADRNKGFVNVTWSLRVTVAESIVGSQTSCALPMARPWDV